MFAIDRMYGALNVSLQRSMMSDVTEIEQFLNTAIETLSKRPQSIEEIREASGKHREFSKQKTEVSHSQYSALYLKK